MHNLTIHPNTHHMIIEVDVFYIPSKKCTTAHIVRIAVDTYEQEIVLQNLVFLRFISSQRDTVYIGEIDPTFANIAQSKNNTLTLVRHCPATRHTVRNVAEKRPKWRH